MYRWAKKKTLDFNIRTTISGSLERVSVFCFVMGESKWLLGKEKVEFRSTPI
jgi:hypothetical protein